MKNLNQCRIESSASDAARTVAYSGIPGAFSESAAIEFFGKDCRRAHSHLTAMGMNLTHIEPRPLHENNWEYCFYVDVIGRIEENTLRVLMESLSKDCVNCRLLGAYEAAVKQ